MLRDNRACGRLDRGLRIASYILLPLFLIELLLSFTFRAVRRRALFGPGFYVVHLLIFFAGPRAIANTLILRSGRGALSNWRAVAVLCTLIAFFLVWPQYGVSEPLFGIERCSRSRGELSCHAHASIAVVRTSGLRLLTIVPAKSREIGHKV